MSAQKIISGEYYDWEKTRQPERPWVHNYHQALVDKMFNAQKGNPMTGAPPQIHYTFAQALERIQRINLVTRGTPKITYVTGWQFDGHDSKYPDWSEVNEQLKRPQDKTARESLLWLMQEGFKHNTTVSLHINMLDAYENAPSWPLYVEKDVIIKQDGKIFKNSGAVWGGEQAYYIDCHKEWESGLAQKRIDALLEMLPIQKAGTIHIDAFVILWVMDQERQRAAMRKVFRYFRDRGIDVTSENMYCNRLGEAFVGLQPYTWHINPAWAHNRDNPEVTEEQWMKIPASLYCGGLDHVAMETGQLFGTSLQGEFIKDINKFLKPFCLQTLPFYFLNRFDRLRLERDGENRKVTFSDSVTSQVENNRRTIYQGPRLLMDGNDVCLPAPWRLHREMIAYSLEGYTSRTWTLPPDWADAAKVDTYQITPDGLVRIKTLDVAKGTISLSLSADQAVSIVPAGTPKTELEAPGISSRNK